MTTFLLGLALGVILIATGVITFKKKNPQFFYLIAKKEYRSALKSLSKKDKSTQAEYADIDRQIAQREAEHSLVLEMPDLSPVTCKGYDRKYHYKDVAVWVRWEYGGHYGKSCESIGMTRGDTLHLLPPKEKDQDAESIAICWKGKEIGYMKSNRLQNMVHSWQTANLPVLAFVAYVGGEDKLLVEIAFYGTPQK